MIAVRTSSRLNAAVERSITVSAPIFNGQAQLGHLFHQGRTLGIASWHFTFAPRRVPIASAPVGVIDIGRDDHAATGHPPPSPVIPVGFSRLATSHLFGHHALRATCICDTFAHHDALNPALRMNDSKKGFGTGAAGGEATTPDPDATGPIGLRFASGHFPARNDPIRFEGVSLSRA